MGITSRSLHPVRLRGVIAALSAVLCGLGSLGCEDVSVSAVPVASVEVVPSTDTLLVGQRLEMSVVVRDEQDNELTGRQIQWTVGNPEVAIIGSDGVVDAQAEGETTVEARAEGVTGQALLTVRPAPSISLEPTQVDFRAVEGRQDPAPDTVRIRNSGEGTLTGLNVLAVEYGQGEPTGWVTAQLGGSTAPTDLVLRADIGSLSHGTYTASVPVQSEVADNSPQRVDVTLTVEEAPPRIDLQPSSWSTSAPFFSPDPVVDTVDVTNGGGETLTGLRVDAIVYDEPEDAGWLEAFFPSEPATAPATLTLEAYARRVRMDEDLVLFPGEYSATVYIVAPDASNSPTAFPVTFTVQ